MTMNPEADTPNDAVHVIVHGRVQGVGFRNWTQRVARQLGLAGWVRNRNDGTVEAVFAGKASAVAAAITRCRRGPRSAKVDHVAASAFVDHDAAPFVFEVRPSL